MTCSITDMEQAYECHKTKYTNGKPRYYLQYTLANPNRDVQIFNKSVPISEFARINEVTLFLWRFSNTKICDNSILPV